MSVSRLRVGGLVAAVCVGMLGLLSSSAFAATPEAPVSGEATTITPTTAILRNGMLNPNAVGGPGNYYFRYAASATECLGGGRFPEPPGDAVGAEKEVVPQVELHGLQPGTQYTFCLVAENNEGQAFGNPVTFTTGTFPASVTEITATSTIFNGEINPVGEETSYRFEYGITAGYGASTPETMLPVTDYSDHSFAAAVQGLLAATQYHYRLITRKSSGTVYGPDETFTTQATGGELALPDDRQYELVSPAYKDGAQVFGIIAQGGPTVGNSGATQASEEGTSMTYLTSAPTGSGVSTNTWATQLLSTRSPTGWSSRDISPPQPNPAPFRDYGGEEYRLFSSDLTAGLLMSENGSQPSFSPEVKGETGENEIYMRNDPTGKFSVLVREPTQLTEFAGATPDLSHVVFNTGEKLLPQATESSNLYEWSADGLRLISVLPDNVATGEGHLGGYNFIGSNVTITSQMSEYAGRHAISTDGNRIVWGVRPNERHSELFSRDMATEETVQVDAAQGGSGSGDGDFQLANSEGTRVFFTDSNELVKGATNANNAKVGGGDLYMFDVLTGKLTDLTPGAGSGEMFVRNGAGRVESLAEATGVLGASEDGTSVYVLSGSVLSSAANAEGETAKIGAPNIYVLREAPVGNGSWTTTYIATLSEMDTPEGGNKVDGYFGGGSEGKYQYLVKRPVRVSPNGRYFAFMSAASLTGYDNRDANSGVPDEEVYLYSAQSNRLVCASCDPTGARPIGKLVEDKYPSDGMDPTMTWKNHWVAAAIPGWNELWVRFHPEEEHGRRPPLYASRVLSNEGRLFFDSQDSLVPQDVNGREDVYEYEPPTSAEEAPVNDSCTTGSSTYSPGSDGCVSLISGGSGDDDFDFVDASASGDDVFFTTSDRLVAEDKDTSTDMYDAHACTSVEPCYPTASAEPPPCVTADGCRVAPSPQPGVFGAPASATFTGAGNVSPGASKPVVKTKGLTRAQLLARALQACRKQNKHKRASCEKTVRKKYGSKAKSSKSGRRSK